VLREAGFGQGVWLMSSGERGCLVRLLLPDLVNADFDARTIGLRENQFQPYRAIVGINLHCTCVHLAAHAEAFTVPMGRGFF